MFTGIIAATGQLVQRVRQGSVLRLFFKAKLRFSPGDSVAIDGVCCTIEEQKRGGFWVSLVGETQRITILGDLTLGARVHLESALLFGDAFHGHVVTGHVDFLARVVSLRHGLLTLVLPSPVRRFCFSKGSIAVNGVSLTIAAITKTGCSIALVPYTLSHTNLGKLCTGDRVHVEVDVLARSGVRQRRKRSGRPPRVAILQATFYNDLSQKLLRSAQRALRAADIRPARVVDVPGCLELPLTAKALAQSGRYDALIALGIVIRGETDHYHHVAQETMNGLMLASLSTGVPIGFGVLTALNRQQAAARLDKGAEAVRAALRVLRNLY